MLILDSINILHVMDLQSLLQILEGVLAMAKALRRRFIMTGEGVSLRT